MSWEELAVLLSSPLKYSAIALETSYHPFSFRGLSMLAAWAWSMEGTADYGKLYKGIWSEDCDKKYPDKSCHIFPWQSSLKIDHVEL